MQFVEHKQVKEKFDFPFSWKGFLRGLAAAILLTLGIFVIGALLLTYTPLPEAAIAPIAIITQVLSVMLAGAVQASYAGHHGYLAGGVTGLAYTLLLYLVSLLVAGEIHFGSYFFILLIIGLFGGAVGGIVGINLFRAHRH